MYETYYDQSATAGMAAFSAGYMITMFIIAAVAIVAMWKIFSKAGEPGWAAIVPLYNAYVLYKIAFGNGWFFLLTFVPFVNFVMVIMLCFKLASAFGRGIGFGFGLLFLQPIFMLILAFGSAEYQG